MSELFYTKPSYDTPTYVPYLHNEVDEIIKEALDKKGVLITKEKNMFKSKGQKLITKLQLESYDSELNYMLAYSNSLDGKMSFKISSGSSVFVCSNGVITGEFDYKRRHTGEIKKDVLSQLDIQLKNFDKIVVEHTTLKEDLKNIYVDKEMMAELAGKMFITEDIIQNQQLSILKQEILKPSYAYKGSDESAWWFYNHCTHAIKNTHPLHWSKTHIEVSNFLKKELCF